MVFNIKFSSNSVNQKKWVYPGTSDKTSHNIYHYLQLRECGLLSKNSKNSKKCVKNKNTKSQRSSISHLWFFDKNNKNNDNGTKKNYYFYPHQTYNSNEFKYSINNIISKYIPGTFSEYELPLTGNDKIFASKWLSDQYIIFGTKNSKLILYNIKNGLQAEIPCQPKELLIQRDLNNVVHKIMNNSWCNNTNNVFTTQTNFGFNSNGNYNFNNNSISSPLYSPTATRPISLTNLSQGQLTSSDVSMSSITVASTSTISNSMQSPISPISPISPVSNFTNSSSDTYVNNTQNDSLMIENEIIVADNLNNIENHSIVSSSNSDDPSSSNQYLTSDTNTTSSSNNAQTSPTVLFPCSGIHSIAINSSNTLLAIGSNKPFEIILYKLPNLYPIAILTGHTDLVFSVEFIDDYTVISGSRDMNISVWNVKQIVTEYENELSESKKETYMDIDDYYNDYFNEEDDDDDMFDNGDMEENNYKRPITLGKSTRSQYNEFMSKVSIPSLPKISSFNYSPSPVHYKVNTIFGTPLYISTPTTVRKEHRDKVSFINIINK